jgi:hypothetical protein
MLGLKHRKSGHTYHMSAIEAGTKLSAGAIQNPAMAREATKEPQLLDAEPQNPVTTKPTAAAM